MLKMEVILFMLKMEVILFMMKMEVSLFMLSNGHSSLGIFYYVVSLLLTVMDMLCCFISSLVIVSDSHVCVWLWFVRVVCPDTSVCVLFDIR